MSEKRIEFEIESDTQSALEVLDKIKLFCKQNNISKTNQEDIDFMLHEAIFNCVFHAYPDKKGKIQIGCLLDGDQIKFQVVDHGVGIKDINQAKEQFFTTGDGTCSGMGFTLMKARSGNEVGVVSNENGTCISLKKTVTLEKELNDN